MTSSRDGSRAAVPAMMALYLLVLLAIGMLRPVRNTLALDGLGQTDFYKVYLVSALAVLFVPLLDRLSDRVALRRLIPGVALFFALNLLAFRIAYVEGSTSFGLIFYGWYDLFAAGLVTQFFMVTQVFFHARLARSAYPLVIAAGAFGASAGGAVTGFLAERLGTPNLLLVAAAVVSVFALALAAVWSVEGIAPASDARSRRHAAIERGSATLRSTFADREVQLIAGLVLMTVLVKQLVDYQFNTITKEIFVERDAIGAFQGKFSAATQWLPILVLAGMRAPLRRWGVGFVVLMLPVAMLLTNVALVLFWGLWAAVAAKGMEGSLRYSAERTGREILYLPVRDGIKAKAKAYIDVAVEKGVGKAASALLIFSWLAWADYRYIALLGATLTLAWIGMAMAVRDQYVRALAYAVERRFASLTSTFASLADRNVVSMLRRALAGDARQIAFALDLLGQASGEDAAALADELAGLLTHPSAHIRRRALDLLARVPGAVAPETYRQRLGDTDADVREAAVRALLAAQPGLLAGLLEAREQETRIATLACVARGEIELPAQAVTELAPRLARLHDAPRNHRIAQAPDRIERVLAAAALRPPDAARIVAAHIGDPDETVARAAVRSAGLLGERALYAPMTSALGPPALRSTAREALTLQGAAVVPTLTAHLLDTSGERTVRRQIPSVLARIPVVDTIPALVRCVLSAETDQTLDHRAIQALSKIRARHSELRFEPGDVEALLSHSLGAAREYASAHRCLGPVSGAGPRTQLLVRALDEAWGERREEVFRCLGLRYAPADVHRCYLAVVRRETVPRANALEWLESTVGYRTFERLAPVLGDGAQAPSARDPADVLERLGRDQDRWLAHCAAAAAAELGAPRVDGADECEARVMDTVERVLLLQQTDVLADARSAYLALAARIAEEIEVEAGTVLVEKDRPADGLYVVVSGEVAATGAGEELRFTEGMAFGAWSLIDALPSVVQATATRPTRLLHVDREEFLDLLADHPELAIGMLQGLARRVRALAR